MFRKKNMRNQFTFYKSFDDVIEELNDKQIAEYIKTMLDVQFLRIKLDDVKFKDSILNIVWKSQKHSISTSIKGYIDSQKNAKIKTPYLGIYDPLLDPSEGVAQQVKDKGQVKEQVQEQEETPKNFSFSLSSIKQLSNTSKEYQEKLEEYIINNNKGMSYQEFYDSCEMKGYKYKNYKLTYDKWNKGKDDKKTANHGILGAEDYAV